MAMLVCQRVGTMEESNWIPLMAVHTTLERQLQVGELVE